MWDVQTAATLDEVWKIALGFLAVELSAERAVVMFDEEGNQEFAVVSHRRVDPHQIWNGSQVDLGVLKQVCKTGRLVTLSEGGRAVICAPVLDNGAVRVLLYADRGLEDELFNDEEASQLNGFAGRISARLHDLAAPLTAPILPSKSTGPKSKERKPPERIPEPVQPKPQPQPEARPAPVVQEKPWELTPAEVAEREPEPELVGAGVGAQPSPDGSTMVVGRMRRPGRMQRVNELVGGRFELGKQLLVCRFSTLYEATDRSDQVPLALRKLEGGETGSREARQQMLREGRFLARLVHRNLPRVLEVLEDKGQVYLVLEELSGITLEQIGQQAPGQIPQDVLNRYFDQFLGVLDYLHGQDPPIVHRDLRPDSILVTTHGVLKLAEFGLARMRESAADPRQTAFRAQGSPFYAPPEQLMGEASSPSNDLYAVGSILYFLATGTHPVKSVDRWYGAIALPPLSEVRPDLDKSFIDLVTWMMESEPDKRPKSVADLRKRLHADAEAEPELEPEPEPEPVPAPIARRMEEVPAPRPQIQETVAEESPGGNGVPVTPSAEPAPRPTSTPSGRLVAPKPQPPKHQQQQQSAFGKLAEKFGAWNFLLPRKKKETVVEYQEEESPIIEFHSDLAAGGELDLSQIQVDPKIGRLLSETVSKAIQGIVVEQPSPTEIKVAVKDPTEVHIYDSISMYTQNQLRPTLVKADSKLIDLAIEFVFRSNQFAENILWNEWLERKSFETDELQVNNPMADVAFGAEEITSPIINAVDRLIKEAISVGASDIHLETYERSMDLRYRIDGQLHVIDQFSTQDASAMVKRLKVMANMDIAQEKVTQGGRISLKVAGQEFDLRVSIVPVPHGESVVMRILKKGAFNLTLRDLGFEHHTMDRFSTILDQPYGMILVCGPTGSGKSTTLYASLKQIQRPDRKLLTVEDPIEYQMPGICQVQVNMAPREEDKKVTFAKVLREFLRQDPDVILVGEIRDSETAAIAVQAALTGHLLLSTIHTNDSVGIIARLTDMQVEPFLIGSTLLGGLAQRLARRICGNCRTEVPVDDEVKRALESEKIPIPEHLVKGVGCKKCRQTGYRGRVGLYELLEVSTEVRDLINRRALEEEVRAAVMRQGFRNLYYDGLTKVARGLVSLEEVQRVCKTI